METRIIRSDDGKFFVYWAFDGEQDGPFDTAEEVIRHVGVSSADAWAAFEAAGIEVNSGLAKSVYREEAVDWYTHQRVYLTEKMAELNRKLCAVEEQLSKLGAA